MNICYIAFNVFDILCILSNVCSIVCNITCIFVDIASIFVDIIAVFIDVIAIVLDVIFVFVDIVAIFVDVVAVFVDLCLIFVDIRSIVIDLVRNIFRQRYFVITAITIDCWCYRNVVTCCYCCSTCSSGDFVFHLFKLGNVNRISICYASFHIVDDLITSTDTVCSVVNCFVPFTCVHTRFCESSLF